MSGAALVEVIGAGDVRGLLVEADAFDRGPSAGAAVAVIILGVVDRAFDYAEALAVGEDVEQGHQRKRFAWN